MHRKLVQFNTNQEPALINRDQTASSKAPWTLHLQGTLHRTLQGCG